MVWISTKMSSEFDFFFNFLSFNRPVCILCFTQHVPGRSLQIKKWIARWINWRARRPAVCSAETSAEPSLQAKQLQLKRARLADDLNDKISHRPGPIELVHKNILSVDGQVHSPPGNYTHTHTHTHTGQEMYNMCMKNIQSLVINTHYSHTDAEKHEDAHTHTHTPARHAVTWHVNTKHQAFKDIRRNKKSLQPDSNSLLSRRPRPYFIKSVSKTRSPPSLSCHCAADFVCTSRI